MYAEIYQAHQDLIYAADTGRVEMARQALAAGADINVRAVSGWTPLMLAVVQGHAPLVRLLIAAGANVNARDNDPPTTVSATDRRVSLALTEGFTALMFAANHDRLEIARLLVQAGANVNAQRDDGDTVLMCAAGAGSPALVQLLLEAGADVNLCAYDGRSAPWVAQANGRQENLRLLLAKGFHPNRKP